MRDREKYDDTIRRDAIGLARGAMNAAAMEPRTARLVVPAERTTITGRVIETPTTDTAQPTVEIK